MIRFISGFPFEVTTCDNVKGHKGSYVAPVGLAKNVTELLNLVCETYNLKIDSAEAVAVEGFIDQLIESKLIMM